MPALRFLSLMIVLALLLPLSSLVAQQVSRGVPESPAAQQAPPSESYVEHARKEGSVQDLTLRDAIELALTHNLKIAIQNYATELNRIQLRGARGFYDPLLNFSVGKNSSTTPTSSVLQGGGSADLATAIPTLTSKISNFGPVLTQNVPGGGAFSTNFANSRTTSDNSLSFINPQYGSTLNFTITQPLWRGGFLQNATRRQIRILQLDRKLTDSQFEQTVSEIVQQVHNGYWNLVFALENYDVARQSRDLARIQQGATAQKVQSGLLAPVSLTSAQAEVALHEQEMIVDEVQIVSGENALKQLLSPDPADSIWSRTLLPTDRPKTQPVNVTLDQAIETALKRRPELAQVGIQLQENVVDRRFFKNQARPAVNLSLGAGSVGAAGTIFAPIFASGGVTPTGFVELKNHPAFGGYYTSWRQAFGFDFSNWNVSVNVQLPIRNRTLEAQYATTVITQQKLMTQQKATAQAIIVDVRNAYESVQLQQKAVDTAGLNRELAELQLRSQTARFESGFTTNFEVLRYQRDLSDARIRELLAQVNYELAIAALQKAMNEIVSANDIELARPPSQSLRPVR